MLDVQYRMCPAISKFPSNHYYAGKLQNAESTSTDNKFRQMMRYVSKDFYGIKEEGSEYGFVAVVRGAARVEPSGISLQNYANADAICLALKRLIDVGMSSKQIIILTNYKGEKTILSFKIEELSKGQWSVEDVATVDAFQGKQARIILLDIVAASKENDALLEKDQFPHLSAYGRGSHRLCVSITRAEYGFIVFGHQRLVLTSASKGSAIVKMIVDVDARKLIFRDVETLNTHPEEAYSD